MGVHVHNTTAGETLTGFQHARTLTCRAGELYLHCAPTWRPCAYHSAHQHKTDPRAITDAHTHHACTKGPRARMPLTGSTAS